MEKGMVYVVYNTTFRDEATNELLYKIGYTKHTPDIRFSHETTLMPGEFKTLFAYRFNNYKEIEKIIHKEFHAFRAKGEWFKLGQKELDLIKARFGEMDGEPVSEKELKEINNKLPRIDAKYNITNDPDGEFVFSRLNSCDENEIVKAIIDGVKQFKKESPLTLYNFGLLGNKDFPDPKHKIVYFFIQGSNPEYKYWVTVKRIGGQDFARCDIQRPGENNSLNKIRINSLESSVITEEIKNVIKKAIENPE